MIIEYKIEKKIEHLNNAPYETHYLENNQFYFIKRQKYIVALI